MQVRGWITRPTGRTLRFAGTIILGWGLLAGTAGSSAAVLFRVADLFRAEAPVSFGAEPIVDTVDALGDQQDEVLAAFDQLTADTGIDLFVAYVDSFSGVDDRAFWADQTAEANGLGSTDVLLAVAVDDRQYQLSVATDFALTDAQLREIEAVAIEPALRQNDWAGAAIGAANGLASALTAETVEPPPDTGDSGPVGPAGTVVPGLLLIVFGLVAIGTLITVFFVVRRRFAVPEAQRVPAGATEAPAAPPVVSLAELKQQASRALVETDDAIQNSEQELGFAVAEYGSNATAKFAAALKGARSALNQAFTRQQDLDDDRPDSDEQRRNWYTEILTLCESANTVLDDQADAFAELRQLEASAGAATDSVASKVASLEDTIDEAEDLLADLSARYTSGATGLVADNPGQADARLTFAASALTEARNRLSEGDSGAAAVAIQAAEEATDQARTLLDAVTRRGEDLAESGRTVTALIAELETDLAAARNVPVEAGSAASLPGTIIRVEQVLADVNARQAAGPANPRELMEQLRSANEQMDAALLRVRSRQAQAERTVANLNHALLAAHSQVSATTDFISARRGGVGAAARTRLAEADRLLGEAEATQTRDAASALADATRARALAAEAAELARQDVDDFTGTLRDDGYGGFPEDRSDRRRRHDQGDDSGGTLGAIIGGILISSILTGGRAPFGGSHGGFPGTRRGGGGSFGGGGLRMPGGFGGSATRSRRGGGGRF